MVVSSEVRWGPEAAYSCLRFDVRCSPTRCYCQCSLDPCKCSPKNTIEQRLAGTVESLRRDANRDCLQTGQQMTVEPIARAVMGVCLSG